MFLAIAENMSRRENRRNSNEIRLPGETHTCSRWNEQGKWLKKDVARSRDWIYERTAQELEDRDEITRGLQRGEVIGRRSHRWHGGESKGRRARREQNTESMQKRVNKGYPRGVMRERGGLGAHGREERVNPEINHVPGGPGEEKNATTLPYHFENIPKHPEHKKHKREGRQGEGTNV
jgi:hypothetical protein